MIVRCPLCKHQAKIIVSEKKDYAFCHRCYNDWEVIRGKLTGITIVERERRKERLLQEVQP